MASPYSPSSHRPRPKKKQLLAASPGSNDLILEPGTPRAAPAFPLVSFLWGARGGVSQWLVLPLTLMAVGLFRWAVSLWGYSGTGSFDVAGSGRC
jgi:alpha-1,3-glucosyltransferase